MEAQKSIREDIESRLLSRDESENVIRAAHEKFSGMAMTGLLSGIFANSESYLRATAMASARDQSFFEFIAGEASSMGHEMCHALCIDLAHICKSDQ
jgi:hypothetical protein